MAVEKEIVDLLKPLGTIFEREDDTSIEFILVSHKTSKVLARGKSTHDYDALGLLLSNSKALLEKHSNRLQARIDRLTSIIAQH
jgi:hypothetical protein